jgi:tetrahydromethanopterin S-methyltransferase subunit B
MTINTKVTHRRIHGVSLSRLVPRLRLPGDGVPNRRELRVFAGYLLAAAVYIAIGVTVIDFLLSFWVGVAYILVAAWAVPTLVRRRT